MSAIPEGLYHNIINRKSKSKGIIGSLASAVAGALGGDNIDIDIEGQKDDEKKKKKKKGGIKGMIDKVGAFGALLASDINLKENIRSGDKEISYFLKKLIKK